MASLDVLGLKTLELVRKLLEEGHLDRVLVLKSVLANRLLCSDRGRYYAPSVEEESEGLSRESRMRQSSDHEWKLRNLGPVAKRLAVKHAGTTCKPSNCGYDR